MQDLGQEHIRLIDQLINEDVQLDTRYLRLRKILDIATTHLVADDESENIAAPNLGRLIDKLNFLLRKYDVYPRKGGIHETRISCNKVIHGEEEPNLDRFIKDAQEVRYFIAFFFGLDIREPSTLPAVEKKHTIKIAGEFTQGPWKCVVTSVDFPNLSFNGIVHDEEDNAGELTFKLEEFEDSSGRMQTNLGFADTIKILSEGDELNLTRIFARDGYYCPHYIIYYPDYLTNVTSIAGSILDLERDIDNWHVHYLYNFLNPTYPKVYFFRGNLVNDMLDELILDPEGFNYNQWLKESFKKFPLEYTAFTKTGDIERIDLINSLKDHQKAILKGVDVLSRDNGFNLDAAEIEPFFMQPIYGLQGRLDVMHFDPNLPIPKMHIVELKTSKVKGFGPTAINPENAAQCSLYDLLTRDVSSKYKNRKKGLRAIFYSSSLDYPIRPHRTPYLESQFLINARNTFIQEERKLANDVKAEDIVPSLIRQLSLRIKGINKFDVPRYEEWQDNLSLTSDIFKLYFGEYLKFALKEKWYAKMGNPISNRPTGGYRGTWIQPLSEKIEDCTVVANLHTSHLTKDDHGHITGVVMTRSNKDQGNDPFKIGDIVLLVEQGDVRFNLDNSLITGTITDLRLGEIEIEIGQRQLGMEQRLLARGQSWMIEHRLYESSYQLMMNNLVALSYCDSTKQNLLLGLDQPTFNEEDEIEEDGLTPQQLSAVNRALCAKDYFLIHGVPGSGKTSRVIKNIVKHEAKKPGNILLLAYTNKAADKLTEVLVELNEEGENIPFFRRGREKAIQEDLVPTLFENKASELKDRTEVQELIDSTKVVISTIAGLKPTDVLFLAKNFRCAIIDESSQILEPTILGILAKVKKFILIGDHKQLPAISLHTAAQGNLSEDHLLRKELGIKSLRNSYFERLFDRSKELGWNITAELTGQGRMHLDIMRFPSHVFYGDKLHLLNDKVQTQDLDLNTPAEPNELERALSQEHILFINSSREKVSTEKTNKAESAIVGDIIESLINMSKDGFIPHKSIGVITPFRNQRGMIRQELLKREIPSAQEILIDTVESFQGSEKDHIIISFSVNDPSQMKLITEWNEDRTVDRKLNVALTRAKKQLIMIGNESVLSHEKIYGNLVEYCRSNEQYLNPQLTPSEVEHGSSILSSSFHRIFRELVIDPIKNDPRTEWANKILGKDHYFNRTQIIEGGRADFTRSIEDGDGHIWSPEDRVLAYCYLNMRLHYHSSKYLFEKYLSDIEVDHFLDIGCGPGTSSVAFSEIQQNQPKYHLLDISEAMLTKACEFLGAYGSSPSKYVRFDDVELFNISGAVILNFSFLFANVDGEFLKELEGLTQELMENSRQVVIINQNSANNDLNLIWLDYKKFLKRNGFTSIGSALNLHLNYTNHLDSEPNKQTSRSYEVLSN